MSFNIYNPLYVPHAVEQILNLIKQIGNNVAITQANIDAVAAQVTSLKTSLDTIATQVNTLIANQSAGNNLSLDNVTTALTGATTDAANIEAALETAIPTAPTSPNPLT